MMLGEEEIENRFGFHKGTRTTMPMHRETRVKFREFAEWLDDTLPESRAKSVALTELETASMWAHKAVAEKAPLVTEDP